MGELAEKFKRGAVAPMLLAGVMAAGPVEADQSVKSTRAPTTASTPAYSDMTSYRKLEQEYARTGTISPANFKESLAHADNSMRQGLATANKDDAVNTYYAAALKTYHLLAKAHPEEMGPHLQKFFANDQAAGLPILRALENGFGPVRQDYRNLRERSEYLSGERLQGKTPVEDYILRSPEWSRQAKMVHDALTEAQQEISAKGLNPAVIGERPGPTEIIRGAQRAADRFLVDLGNKMGDQNLEAASSIKMGGQEVAKLKCLCTGGTIDMQKLVEDIDKLQAAKPSTGPAVQPPAPMMPTVTNSTLKPGS